MCVLNAKYVTVMNECLLCVRWIRRYIWRTKVQNNETAHSVAFYERLINVGLLLPVSAADICHLCVQKCAEMDSRLWWSNDNELHARMRSHCTDSLMVVAPNSNARNNCFETSLTAKNGWIWVRCDRVCIRTMSLYRAHKIPLYRSIQIHNALPIDKMLLNNN